MRSRTDFFELDITKHCEIFFGQDAYYQRTMKFDSQHDLDVDFVSNVKRVRVKIHPFTSEAMSNFHLANKIVIKEIGEFPEFEHLIHRGNLRLAKGLVIIEIDFEGDYTYTENLRIDEETDIEKVMNWDMDFEDMRQKMISLSSDICSFLLLGLHILFPTQFNSHETHKPKSSGLLTFIGEKRYIMDEHSDIFSYPLLLESDRIPQLEIVLPQIALVWSKNIWSFYRFLKGVRSDYVTIDHFLDLVFTFESFFADNTSTEVMKLISSIVASENKQEASDIQQMLTYCFRIRNHLAHGGTNFRLHDHVPKNKNEPQEKLPIVKLYWQLKNLNIKLMYKGIIKMLTDKNPQPASSIRFGIVDISDKYFG